jgi:hypothetical protein
MWICAGAYFAWMQQLALDGTVLTTDALEAIVARNSTPYDEVVALGRTPSGALAVMVAEYLGAKAWITRFRDDPSFVTRTAIG